MKLQDTLWLGVKGISQRKFRTALTVLSVAIGIAAIVALISLVSGISSSITSQLSSIGPTTLYLTPKTGIFTVADVAEIEGLPNVSSVIPLIRFSANVTVGGTSTTATVIGVDSDSIGNVIGGINLYDGSLYNDSALPYAAVGHAIAFPNTGQLTPSVTLDSPLYLTQHTGGNTRSITLIPEGLLNTYGSSFFISADTSIFISLAEAELLNGKQSYSVLLVQANNLSSVNALDTLLTNVFGSSATITSVQAISATISSVTGSLSILLGGIAGISLVVAGISILSIMMVSVTERTHEIGILKSIGFKKGDVLIIFIAEAVIIGLLGGTVGIALGGGAAYALPALLSAHSAAATSTPAVGSAPAGSATFGGGGSGRTGGGGAAAFGGGSSSTSSSALSGSGSTSLTITPMVSPTIIGAAMFLAIMVSVLSSLYPAWKASTVDPIKALRSAE